MPARPGKSVRGCRGTAIALRQASQYIVDRADAAVMKDLVLVTGGAGFIGSHMCVALAQANVDFVVLDNFRNSRRSVIERLGQLCGRPITLVEADVCDAAAMNALFARYPITAVAHFAADKAVGESMRAPLVYYRNNVMGALQLLESMAIAGVRKLVFSSSATVYGAEVSVPYTENSSLAPVNPYGETKLAVEKILHDLCRSDSSWHVASLRYFNPVGAHASGLIGEDPMGIPNNLMPFIAQVACGKRPSLQVFGGDYATMDGTGVRDYVHVMDLVEGHVAALAHLDRCPGFSVFNLGTGSGVSVLQMLSAFERASGRRIAHDIVGRRDGDLPAYWADASLARQVLGWEATRTVDDMCSDVWRWQQYWTEHGREVEPITLRPRAVRSGLSPAPKLQPVDVPAETALPFQAPGAA
jgi:UDP-glucose 4-epimerase